MLQRAMDARGQKLGRTYTLDDLGRESGTDFSLASKVMTGRRRPTREALEAWAKVLSPHLDLDAALIAAGHAPADQRKAGILRQAWRLSTEQWAQFERWVGERATHDEAEGDAGEEHKQADSEDEPPAKA